LLSVSIALFLPTSTMQTSFVAEEPVWTDEFTTLNPRWDWDYSEGTGYKQLTTIDDVSVVEIGITDQSSSSSYSDCSLHETSYQYTNAAFEARLRCTDDNGINQPGQGTKGWGFWNYENPPSIDSAWFWSASPESEASVTGFQAMVARGSIIVFQESLPEVDMREWHIYRVELLPTGTRFLVDGEEVAFTSHRPDRPQRIEMWIDNYYVQVVDSTIQLGYLDVEQDQRMYIDWVSYYDYSNRPPVLDPIGDKSVNEDDILTFTVTATDPDRDGLTYSAGNLPTGATFDSATQVFSWTPANGQTGVYTNVSFTVTDDSNPPLSDSEEITITVTGANDLSHIDLTPATATRMAGRTISYTLTAYDAYGNDWDVTADGVYAVAPGAGGSWVDHIYTSEIAGTWMVTGTYGGEVGTATLTVSHALLDYVNLMPVAAIRMAGQSIPFTLTAYDAHGNSWDVTVSADYSIEQGAGGIWIDNVYTAQVTGTWAVTGTWVETGTAIPYHRSDTSSLAVLGPAVRVYLPLTIREYASP
jgi:hypothetical protein